MRQLACLAFLFLCGCGGASVGKVTGVVTLDDKPIAFAEVTFWAKDDPAPTAHATRTGADGRFELFQDPRPGAHIKPGRHVVVVTKFGDAPKETEPAAVAPGQEAGNRNALPTQYADKSSSPFEVDVQRGDNDFKFELKSRP